MDDVFLLYFTMSPPLTPHKQTNKQLTNRGLTDIGGLIYIPSYWNK